MKKLLTLVLAFLTLASFAHADSVDISSMNYEERKELYDTLSAYFDKTFTLAPGIYEVGKDIKAGTYRFMYEENSGWFTRIRIGDDDGINVSKTDLNSWRQKFDLYDPFGASYYFQLTEAYYRLKEGDYVVVEFGKVRMVATDKQLSW